MWRIADLSRTSRHFRQAPIMLKKSVRAHDPNFSGTWAGLPKKDVGGALFSLTTERAASAPAVRSLSTTPVNDNVHCGDFRRLPFSEFFNNIRHFWTLARNNKGLILPQSRNGAASSFASDARTFLGH